MSRCDITTRNLNMEVVYGDTDSIMVNTGLGAADGLAKVKEQVGSRVVLQGYITGYSSKASTVSAPEPPLAVSWDRLLSLRGLLSRAPAQASAGRPVAPGACLPMRAPSAGDNHPERDQ